MKRLLLLATACENDGQDDRNGDDGCREILNEALLQACQRDVLGWE